MIHAITSLAALALLTGCSSDSTSSTTTTASASTTPASTGEVVGTATITNGSPYSTPKTFGIFHFT